MKKYFLLLLIVFAFPFISKSQNETREKLAYEIINGDTVFLYNLPTVWCRAPKVFKTDLDRYHYNQMKYNIKVAFPYIKEAGRIFREVDAQLPNLSNREKRKFIKQKEEELRVKFEEPLKNLNDTQGKLLLLLINRETGNSVYRLLKEIKNPVRAALYETTALANGYDLNKQWDSKVYKSEEEIMEDLEMEYGYSTPN